MTFTEAGDELGMSKQGVHRLIFDSAASPINVSRDVRAVGEKPIMLVRTSAVAAEKRRREAIAAARRAAAAAPREPAPRRRRVVG